MSYPIDDDAHDSYELREKIRKLQERIDDAYVPESENVGATYRNLMGYSFGSSNGRPSSSSGGDATPVNVTDEINKWMALSENMGLVWARDSYQTVKSDLKTAYDWVNDAPKNITNTINTWLNETAQAGLKWIKDSYRTIQSNIKTAYDWVNNAVNNVVNTINNWLNGTAQAGLKWIKDSYRTVQNNLDTAYRWVSDAANRITGEINTWLNRSAQDGLKWIKDTYQTVKSNLKTSYDWVSSASKRIADELTTWMNRSAQAGLQWIRGSYRTVQSNIKAAYDWVQTATNNIRSTITSSGTHIKVALGSAWSNLAGWYNSISSTVRTAIGNIPSTISDFIFGNRSSSTQGGSKGDVDLKTYDLTRVDRIFFDSNDSLNTGSSYPHITGKSIGNRIRSMMMFVPSGSSFYFYVARTNIVNISNTNMVCSVPFSTTDSLNARKGVNIRESVKAGYVPSSITDNAILFCRPTASGKTELRVKFQSGASKLLAVQS